MCGSGLTNEEATEVVQSGGSGKGQNQNAGREEGQKWSILDVF